MSKLKLCLQWSNLLNAMLREAEWARDMSVPTMDEYIANGYVSFALGPIVLPALYFVGPKLPNDVVQHPEYQSLFKLMSTCGRLLNDIRSFEVYICFIILHQTFPLLLHHFLSYLIS